MTDERTTTTPERLDHSPRADGANRPFSRLISCMAHEASPNDHANLKRYMLLMIVWFGVSFVDASWFGATEGDTSATTLAIGVAQGVAIVGIVASFAKYVRETDELNRSIQLRALSLGFGAGFGSAMIAEAAAKAGLVQSVDVDVPVLVMLMTYAVASVVITRRYR